jgi:hypothetical protein
MPVPADPSSPIPAALAQLVRTDPCQLQHHEASQLPAYLAAIPDPRAARGRRHPLACILGLAAAAVLAGRGSFGLENGPALLARWFATVTPAPSLRPDTCLPVAPWTIPNQEHRGSERKPRRDLEGFFNARDLGGLPTRDARVTDRGALILRSADPRFAPEAGWRAAQTPVTRPSSTCGVENVAEGGRAAQRCCAYLGAATGTDLAGYGQDFGLPL